MEKNSSWKSFLGPDFFVDLYKTTGRISEDAILELEKHSYPLDFLFG